MEGLVVFAVGALGGLANILLMEQGFRLPAVVTVAPERRSWDPGFISPILLGGVAALVTYWLGTSELEAARRLGIALVSGIGGGNVLVSFVQRYTNTVLKAQVDALQEALRKAVSDEPEPPGS